MYEQFYRLTEKPFNLTPDPKFFFMSKQHQGAMDHLLYGIRQREGFMAVVGAVGTGKTTLCRCLLEKLEPNIKVALVLNPMISGMDLLRTCVQDLEVTPVKTLIEDPLPPLMFGDEGEGSEEDLSIDPESLAVPIEDSGQEEADAALDELVVEDLPQDEMNGDWVYGASKMELIDALNDFLLEQHRAGGSTVLIIDEAQNLSLDVMEQLRVLSNLETEKEKLLQIIFVGQKELNEKLQRPELKQLNQRISIRYEIGPLTKEETSQYVQHRIRIAGAGARVSFNKSAVNEVYRYSKGTPRLINLVCDRALLGGYSVQADTIERSHVKQAIQSLLGKDGRAAVKSGFLKSKIPAYAAAAILLVGLASVLLPRFDIDFKKETEGLLALVGGFSFFQEDTETVSLPAPRSKAKPSVKPPQAPAAVSHPMLEPVKATPAAAVERSDAQATIPLAFPQGSGDYRIQLYSLNEVALANEEVERLKEEGFDAYWKKASSRGQDWYIVYVGPFKDMKPARIYLDALKYSGRNPILLSVSKSG